MNNFFNIIAASLLTFSVVGTDKNSFAYVSNKYEQKRGDVGILFYPAKNPKRMLVSFSFSRRNYSMWSWFWNNQEQWEDTCYLFVRDLREFGWYLNYENDSFEERLQGVISYFLSKHGLKEDNCFFIGSSKGGYGALYHGVKMGIRGVIAFNPQVDKESAIKSHWGEIIGSAHWFKGLPDVINETNFVPRASLYASSNIKDFAAAQSLVNSLMKKNSFFMYTKVNKNYHSGADMFDFNKELVERDVLILEGR